MIKVGIIGAEQPAAGELLRILVNHPDIEIVTLSAPTLSGRHPSVCHFGFVGTDLPNFTDRTDPASLDVVFLADCSAMASDILANTERWPKLRVIDLSAGRYGNMKAYGLEYGLSEMNRKPLVRGARMAAVPGPLASLALVALHPLAMHLLLNGDITIEAEVPDAMLRHANAEQDAVEIAEMLAKTQSSFKGKVTVNMTSSGSPRAMRLTADAPCQLSLAEIDRLYDSVYDDHNFTFTSLSDTSVHEVEGTQKCVLSLSKPDPTSLRVSAVGDACLRGGAGDAVHVMNLLFALDEKVGLALKPCSSMTKTPAGQPQACWFA